MGDCKIAKLYCKLCCYLSCLQSPLLLVMRLYWGYSFFMTGKGKLLHLERVTGFFADLGIPYPHLNAMMAGATECVGGLLLVVGLCTRLACIPLTILLSVAYATAHREAVVIVIQSIQGWSFSLDEFVKQEPFPFLVTVLVVMAFGPGKFSLDYLLMRKNCQKDA